MPPKAGTLKFRFFKVAVGLNVLIYRLSGGRVLGTYGGSPVLLLDHVGAKSGQKRTTPVTYIPDGDDLLILASRGGSPVNPAWFYNLRANPETTVQVKSDRRAVRAAVMEGPDREAAWGTVLAAAPEFEDYQAKTEREIPVIRLRSV